MRNRGWSKTSLVKELGVPENSVRRLLNLRHNSQMGIVDAALAQMNTELPIGPPSTHLHDRRRLREALPTACDNFPTRHGSRTPTG